MMQRHLVAMFLLCAPLCACEEAPAPEGPPALVIEEPDAAPDVAGPCAAGCAPRLVNLPAEASAPRGGTGTFQVVAEDQDDPGSLSFTVSERCALTSRVDAAGVITVGCPPVAETCVMWVGVKDGGELRDDQQLTMRCDEERAPEFLTTPPATARVGEETSYAARCVDANNDLVSLSVSGGDTCGGRLARGEYRWVPREGEASCAIALSCRDGRLATEQVARVEIDDALRLKNLPATAEGAGEASSFAVETRGGSGAPLGYEIMQTSCPFAVGVSAQGVVGFECGAGRTSCEARVRVRDGEEAVEGTLRIECNNQAPAFVMEALPPASEGVRYRYEPRCEDGDGEPVVIRGVGGTCPGLRIGGYIELTPDETQGGTSCTAIFDCSDGLALVEQTMSLEILEVNRRPRLVVPARSVSQRQRAQSIDVDATDADLPRQQLSLTVEDDCSFDVSVMGGSASYECGAAEEECAARVSVSDGIESVTAEVQISCVNVAPSALWVEITGEAADSYARMPLRCEYFFDDLDFDDPDMSTVEWWINGQPAGVGATLPTYPAGALVECRVTPFDGITQGAPRSRTKRMAAAQGVAAGGDHGCAIRAGKLYCWGDNTYGQLGDGTTVMRERPVLIAQMSSEVEAVVTGAAHTCAVKAGALYCWGRNHEGQLGDGTTQDQAAPTLVQGAVAGVEQLALGGAHSCARRGGDVWCWGDNTHGQLGDGTTTARHTPTAVASLSGALLIAAGEGHTCAQDAGGYSCWGDNTHGQLGDGSTTAQSSPVRALATTWAGRGALAAGGAHTCATANGRLYCWGDNREGQVGDGSSETSRRVPTLLASVMPSFARQLSAGGRHTCAMLNGLVHCWGINSRGQAGALSQTARSPMPVQGTWSDVWQVSAGRAHSCFIRTIAAGQEVRCWGDNETSQLGYGRSRDQAEPVEVQEIGMHYPVFTGARHSCAVSRTGLLCWGDGSQTQVASGGGVVPQRTLSGQQSSSTLVGTAGAEHTCLSNGSRVECRGRNISSAPLAGNWPALSGGGGHTCASSATEVRCWGENGSGQLGDGTTTERPTPVQVLGLAPTQHELAAGESHTCALAGGAVYCWGDNSHGQLGDGTTVTRGTPAAVLGMGMGVSQVFAGAEHTCAIQFGALYCWGSNASGQLGDGTTIDRSTPTLVLLLLADVARGGAGAEHTCAARVGALYCWGDNSHGQLGDGTFTSRSLAGLVPKLAQGVNFVDGGDGHTCAVQGLGALYCWGSNSHAQLGYGVDLSWIPVLTLR